MFKNKPSQQPLSLFFIFLIHKKPGYIPETLWI